MLETTEGSEVKVVDKNRFFREATVRICGNLEIEAATQSLLSYLDVFIPAEFAGFVVYLPEEENYETITFVSQAGDRSIPHKFPVTRMEQTVMRTNFKKPRIRIMNRRDESTLKDILPKGVFGTKTSCIIVEMILSGTRTGAFFIGNEIKVDYTKEHARLLELLNEPLGIALTNSIRYNKLKGLKDILIDDKQYLQEQLLQMTEQSIVGSETGLKEVMASVRRVAGTNSPVLLLGESGVGKEVVAHALHKASARKNGPFIKVNCGAIPLSLIDSELFGHEKGAFTGAVSAKRGRFERANGGTIFLDEIGELPMEAQVRMLRVLQDMEIERVGSEQSFMVDCRVVAATHRNLEERVRQGKLREDLYFRLMVFPIRIPPLRERKADIPLLVSHFIGKKSREHNLPAAPGIADDGLKRLMAYHWPGNVRELENSVERTMIINRRHPLTFDDLQFQTKVAGYESPKPAPALPQFPKLERTIARHIEQALILTAGKIEGKDGAAALLGLNPSTLRQKMRKLGIPFGKKMKKIYRSWAIN